MSCSAVELVGRDADITTRPGLLQAWHPHRRGQGVLWRDRAHVPSRCIPRCAGGGAPVP